MKVSELRHELEINNLPTTGIKQILVDRLKEFYSRDFHFI